MRHFITSTTKARLFTAEDVDDNCEVFILIGYGPTETESRFVKIVIMNYVVFETPILVIDFAATLKIWDFSGNVERSHSQLLGGGVTYYCQCEITMFESVASMNLPKARNCSSQIHDSSG